MKPKPRFKIGDEAYWLERDSWPLIKCKVYNIWKIDGKYPINYQISYIESYNGQVEYANAEEVNLLTKAQAIDYVNDMLVYFEGRIHNTEEELKMLKAEQEEMIECSKMLECKKVSKAKRKSKA